MYQRELDKACFQHDMVYGDFKDLTWRTISNKIFCDKAFNIGRNPKYVGYVDLLQWFIIFLIKKLLAAVFKIRIIQTKN